MDRKRKVLVVGSGGREHALCWKLAASPRVGEVLCAPGNAGIQRHARCVPVGATDLDGLVALARSEGVDLTVVGPEAPLAAGLVDRFQAEGLRAFGPARAAARLEASKVFTKDLMARAGIPSAGYRVFEDLGAALAHIAGIETFPVVLKADGLAAGKGVIVARDRGEAEDAARLILEARAFGEAGRRLVVEDFLAGEEASFMAVTDGRTVLPLATSQDHKPVFDGDRGPNTGGMGAYSPAPVVTPAVFDAVMERIMRPTVAFMDREGCPYRGVLYGGLMIQEGEPRVLEFNCRFGDPEAQPILMRLRSDLMELFEAAEAGRLDEVRLEWDPRAAVCVVLASKGYPGGYEKGKVIHGLEEAAAMEDVMVFHAGTAMEDGRYVTAGGRVLGVTALGDDIQEAIHRAYQAVERISWEGMHYRTDIGAKAARHLGG
ncbi:phosphoribosylamine--glycine ligase [Dissulfurirhabdus thermomarina]|uniref:Phosphoribosylamine--glycine ligase n=1 Tax=Dissulfurirhabdus thermomarina TaxID=1765737 RepID=A0A6N9TQX6_DISTH|nr:phosphoribosylamine--glycine ligase [Dissulfurirhabdus thermomarina]NDY42850.1 phosphoribosylamine--glycine ligase [Dissulfurirhabdus thermomarina]NMX23248.1 phosphoribosylamine--glycine ligase [Dissulfurirhabdus thermomarina]